MAATLDPVDTRPDGAADDPAGGQQDGLFDKVIDDAELAALLDERAKRNAAKKTATAKFKEKHEAAKHELEKLDLADGDVVRCGKHRIKVTRPAPREVSFTTNPNRRMTFSLLEDS